MSPKNHPSKTLLHLLGSRLCGLMLLIGFAITPAISNAQGGLLLTNFNIPDTIYLNSTVPVNFNITNTLDSAILGNLKINFLNETFNNVEAPLGGFEAVQYFSAGQERDFTTLIPVEPQYFLEGGNTVVIWPSFVGQEIPAVDSVRITVFVAQSNGISGISPIPLRDYILPNPVQSQLSIIPRNGALLPASIRIFDLSGRFLLGSNNLQSGVISVDLLKDGIYLLELHTKDGKVQTGRFIKVTN